MATATRTTPAHEPTREHPIGRAMFEIIEVLIFLLVLAVPLLTVAVYYASTH